MDYVSTGANFSHVSKEDMLSLWPRGTHAYCSLGLKSSFPPPQLANPYSSIRSLAKKTIPHSAPITAFCKVYCIPDFLVMGLLSTPGLKYFLASGLSATKMQATQRD